MDLTPWAPLIALGGVALGSVVTFVGQWLTRRQTSQLSIASQRAALRDDRRTVIFGFLEAVQGCHSVMSRERKAKDGSDGGEQDFHERAEVVGELWFRLALVKTLCRVDVIESANRCVEVVTKALSGDEQAWYQMSGVEADFMEAARFELYSSDVFE